MLWIRIRGDPQHFGNKDPHPHQLKIRVRIRIKICELDPQPDPNPQQFADVKPICMEYEPILAPFQGVHMEPGASFGGSLRGRGGLETLQRAVEVALEP